jgi:hypothetical protein
MSQVSRRLSSLLPLLLLATPAAAQEAGSSEAALVRVAPLPTLGGVEEDRMRVRQLLGERSDGFLLRSTSVLAGAVEGAPPGRGAAWLALYAPELRTTWNSEIPFSQNEGAMWSGRGWTTRVLTGVGVHLGAVSLRLAPELVRAQNREFQYIPGHRHGRSEFIPPWQNDTLSIDMPIRFGEEALLELHPGQSSLSIALGGLALGAGTENHWWGPGLRNAIVLSSQAAGFPHLVARSARPLLTRAGEAEAVWLVGRLSDSPYFSTWEDPGFRSFSGFGATFRPAGETGLTLGMARVVYAPVNGFGGALARAGDVFLDWSGADDRGRESRENPSEQIFALFGRWVHPRDRLEVYGEWARYRLPLSLRDLLAQPNHTQGYTLGFQWARPAFGSDLLRLQAEATNLEQSATFRLRPIASYYTSIAVPQGYTHGGQVLGAAIGPGASSQWVATDYLAPRSSLGVFAGRIRWNNDAYYHRLAAWPTHGHDVSMLAGLRGSARLAPLEVAAEYTAGKRLNYLYQNWGTSWEGSGDAIDVLNHTLRLTLTMAHPARSRPRPVPAPLAPVLPSADAGPSAPVDPSEETAPPAPAEPAGARPEPAAPPCVHRVERGETLWAVARRYGVSVEALQQANGLTSDRILIGQALGIPPR